MRTLITLALIVITQMAFAQPFFIGSEPVIVQNQDSTYSWFENGTLVPIAQPKGRIFTWEEMLHMERGGVVKREKVTESVTRFELRKFPFLTQGFHETFHQFKLSENKIVAVKEYRQVNNDRGQLFLIFLMVSLLVAIMIPHDSPVTFSLVGIAMVLTIIAANYFDWWGYGAGLIATIVAKIKNDHPYHELSSTVVLAFFLGLLSLPFRFEWSDQESKNLFMVTISCIITIAFLVRGLYIWRKRTPGKGGDIEFV